MSDYYRYVCSIAGVVRLSVTLVFELAGHFVHRTLMGEVFWIAFSQSPRGNGFTGGGKGRGHLGSVGYWGALTHPGVDIGGALVYMVLDGYRCPGKPLVFN